MHKKIIASTLALALAFSLSACSNDESSSKPSASDSTSATPKAPEVKYTDKGMPTLGENAEGNPILKFPADSQAPKDITVSRLEEGTGEEVSPSDFVVVDYAGFVWGSEEAFDSSFERGGSAGFGLSSLVSGWQYGLDGAHVGDKVILSIPADYGYGPSGGNESAGISKTDTIAFYIEIHDRFNGESAGQKDATVEVPSSDLPVTYTGELGEPITEIAVKDGQASPSETSAKVIAKGTGAEVGQSGTLVIAYAASTWDKSTVENTWTGQPDPQLKGPQSVTMGQGVIFDALAGTTVGSRVLILMPASEGSETANANAAYAIVVDVLGFIPTA